jgi:aminoglycoside phosphotransferase (APT) family kinase protein
VSEFDLEPIFAELRPLLGEPQGDPVALSGGITNRNLLVAFEAGDYVLRICTPGVEIISIDRETEVQANRNAHEAGVAPAVAAWLPGLGCLVTAFVPGEPMTPEAMAEPARIAELGAALRMVHAGPGLPSAFPTFTLAEEYEQSARELGGGARPEDLELARELTARVGEAVAGRPGHESVPCHNDMLTANFIATDDGLVLVDWEYAGMNDRFFDLGNAAVNNEFGDEQGAALLRAYFGAEPEESQVASLALMRLMSDVREAMWGVVQSAASRIDFDYDAYAAQHFDRLRRGAEDPRLEGWLRGCAS